MRVASTRDPAFPGERACHSEGAVERSPEESAVPPPGAYRRLRTATERRDPRDGRLIRERVTATVGRPVTSRANAVSEHLSMAGTTLAATSG
jgi:hypothetical protein